MGGYPWETVPSNCWAWFEAETWRIRSCFCTPVRCSECREINKTNRRRRRKKTLWKRLAIPNVLSVHTGLRRVSISSHTKMYGRYSEALLYAFPLLIVNSVNEVNLINFRAGSHMTFSSIFSPTSKTSISSSKIGRSEWQSTITDLFEAKSKSILRFLNVFITIFKEDLQIAKKLNLSPRNVQIFFVVILSVSRPRCVTQKRNGAAFSLTHYNRSQCRTYD